MITIVFFGTHTLATTVLNELFATSGIRVLAVVTQPDKPAGRGGKLETPLVKRFAEQHGLPVLQFAKLKDGAIEQLCALNADVFVVAEYGLLIPPVALGIPPHGALNVHPSLLPKYRGASPIQCAILNGDAETGVSIMLLDKEMDHGPILKQKRCAIDEHDTAPTLEAKLGRHGAQLLISTLPDWIAHNIQPREQDHAQATFCKKLTRDDGRVDWTASADHIYRMWRAYLPWPGIFTMWNGKRLILTSLREAVDDEAIPSASHRGIPFLTPNKNLAITCGSGAIIVERLQLEGKKELNVDAFLRGYTKFLNDRLT